MKGHLALTATFLLVRSLFGAAPESVAGMTYYEESVTTVRSNAAEGRVLNPDGTYRGLFFISTYGANTVGAPWDGTWNYRKTSETTAELSFGPASEIRVLTFSDDASGTLRGAGQFARMGTFKFVSSAARRSLTNFSNRSFVRAGSGAFFGFVVADRMNRMLLRAVGPGLSAFGVQPVLAAPIIKVHSADAVVAENAGWNSTLGRESISRTSALVGAFPLSSTSSDSATIVVLPPGAYTVEVSSPSPTDSGEVLIESYVLP